MVTPPTSLSLAMMNNIAHTPSPGRRRLHASSLTNCLIETTGFARVRVPRGMSALCSRGQSWYHSHSLGPGFNRQLLTSGGADCGLGGQDVFDWPSPGVGGLALSHDLENAVMGVIQRQGSLVFGPSSFFY
jgi:hypothetical protein